MTTFWHISTDQLVTLTGLYDNTGDVYVNDATVSCQLTDKDGENVGSSFALSYDTASDGNYSGTMPSSVTSLLTEGQAYTLTCTVTSGTTTMTIKREGFGINYDGD